MLHSCTLQEQKLYESNIILAKTFFNYINHLDYVVKDLHEWIVQITVFYHVTRIFTHTQYNVVFMLRQRYFDAETVY